MKREDINQLIIKEPKAFPFSIKVKAKGGNIHFKHVNILKGDV